MTVLYDRKLLLTVSPPTSATALDLSAFRIRFQIIQKSIETPNTADIRIYNLSKETVSNLTASGEKVRVRLSAGYVGAFGLLFDGTVIQSRSGRESPVDTFLDLICADGDLAYNNAVVNTSLAAGVTPKEHLSAVIAAMKEHDVTEGYVPELTTGTSPRGRSLFGMARDFIRDIAHSNDCSWSIQNNQVNLVPDKGALPGEAVVLTAETGMIGLPTQTELGISVRTLIIPAIKVGGRVHINNASIQRARIDTSYGGAVNNAFLPRVSDDGFYRVLVVNWFGDTRGNEWYADAICIAMGDPITKGLVSRGVNDDAAPAPALTPTATPG